MRKIPNPTAATIKSVDTVATCELAICVAASAPAFTPKLLATISAKAAITSIEKR